MKYTKEQKEALDSFVGHAVKEGYLDEKGAMGMSYKDKEDYLNWSDFMANTYKHEYLGFGPDNC